MHNRTGDDYDDYAPNDCNGAASADCDDDYNNARNKRLLRRDTAVGWERKTEFGLPFSVFGR